MRFRVRRPAQYGRGATCRERPARVQGKARAGLVRRNERVRRSTHTQQEGRQVDEGVRGVAFRCRGRVRLDRLVRPLEIFQKEGVVVMELRVPRLELEGSTEALQPLLV